MLDRKREETEFHNLISSKEVLEDQNLFAYYYSNAKYYSISEKSDASRKDWLQARCKGKSVLVLGCGNGAESFYLAREGANVIGIDLSDLCVENARKTALEQKLDNKARFLVMDAENMQFPDDSFDLVTATGMLHHTDFEKVIREVARVLKPEGEIIGLEPLAYNPVIQLYRRLTPHLRTEWETEHIFARKELDFAKPIFEKIEVRYFHLLTLFAVPFRKLKCFRQILSFLETLDQILLSLPLVRWLAWQIVFSFKRPIKRKLCN